MDGRREGTTVMKNLYAVATALILGTFNTACMETGALQGVVGLQSGSNYSVTVQDDEATCMSGEWNATPSSSIGYPGEFHVCGDDTDAYSLHIDGELKTKSGGSYIGYEVASRICVFPSQVYDYGGASGKVAVFKADEAGFPMYSCFEIDADESTGEFDAFSVRFNLTTFDSAFVIDSRYFNQMRSCLLSGNDSSCPDYAFGQFRTLDASDLTQDQ
jgi:hypothetical protein